MPSTRLAAGCLLIASVALAQTRPQFEVASVRPSSEQVNAVNVGLQITGSQVRVASMSLKDYIGVAYRVRLPQVEGPEWLAQDRFDIVANIPEGGSAEQVPEMLQALLAERFELKMHREMREFPVYALAVAKSGFKLQPVPDAPEAPAAGTAVTVAASGTGGGVAIDMGGGSSFTLRSNRLEVRRMTMEVLGDLLERFLDRPVIDATALTGRFDVAVDLAPEDYNAMLIRAAVNNGMVLPPQALRLLDGATGDRLAAPLQTVGLTLESRRAPLEVLVIDSVRRTPTEN